MLVRETGSVTVAGLEGKLGISAATARRDLALLERRGMVKRIHDGAVPPGLVQHEAFIGPCAISSVESYVADRAFFSVKGITPGGHLTEPNPLEAEVKQAMIRRSEEPVLLVDGRKFERRGASVIAHVSEVSLVITADAHVSHVKSLEDLGVDVRSV